MKRISTLKSLALVAGMMLMGAGQAWAGNGTKESPYTVAELNAQKDALAESGNTVWVKADLKGLGADGTQTQNEGTTQCAGLFGDAQDSFVAYSYQILGELALSDLTNTKDLLIALTYGTTAHPYGNTANPQYASNYEPADAHFSLAEVHGALSVNIENGLRGYHVASAYVIPKDVIAVKVSAGYSKNVAYVNYTNFDGAEATYVTPKNAALVLMANSGTYDFVLSADLNEQKISNGNALGAGTQAGVNAGTTNNRTRLAFVNDGTKAGFQKNSDQNCTVTLQSKDEVFLQVSSLATNFYGNWNWETDAMDWITWTGGKYGDFHPQATFDFTSATIRENIGTAMADVKGNIYNETFKADDVSLQVTAGSSATKLFVDKTRGQCLVTYKEYSTLTFKAPDGYAITKIEFTGAGTSLANINNYTFSSGSREGMVWRGNAEGVRCYQGGTSYLANAKLTLAAKTESTVSLPAIQYTECANIAAFNALDNGSYAKVMLKDAEVIGLSPDGFSTAWIQDATGGCQIQYSTLIMAGLKEKTKLNGFVYVVKRMTEGNVQMKEAEDTPKSELSAADISEYTMITGTVSEINTLPNLNRVVKITGATFEATGTTTGTLIQGNVSIKVNNGSTLKQLGKIKGDWTAGDKMTDVTIVAVLSGTARISTSNDTADLTKTQLLPLSITGTANGISEINADFNAADVKIYNLQGVRLNQLQRGLNIVNGKKVVIK